MSDTTGAQQGGSDSSGAGPRDDTSGGATGPDVAQRSRDRAGSGAGSGAGLGADGPGPELDGWTNERLEDGLTSLAGQIAAATCRFLLLLAEYDRRRGWAAWDCVSAAQWLSWRCQIGPRTAREYLRVAHRLGELPRITGEFSRGRISYSKVRAITRVATTENEEDLLSLARRGTAAQLERAVSAYRRIGRLDDATAAAEQTRTRALRWHHEADGSMVIRARVPAARGQVVLTALRAMLEDAGDARDPGGDGSAQPAAPLDDRATDGPGDGSAEPGGHTDRGSDHADHRDTRDGSAEPAETVADEVADDPRAAAYADALVDVAEHYLADRTHTTSTGDRFQVVVHVDAETLADVAADGDASLDDGRPLAPDTVRRLACDASIVPLLTDRLGEPLDIGRRRRAIPAGLRRAVLARDRRCRYPICDRPIDEIHHIVHWADRGGTELSNLLGLCWFHHDRHHQGGFEVERSDDGTLTFTLTDGRTLTDWSPPDASLDELLADLAQRDIEIGSRTAVADWAGDPLDLELATWILATRGDPHPDGHAEGHDPREGWIGATERTRI